MSAFMYHQHTMAILLAFFALVFMIVAVVLYERSIRSHPHGGSVTDHFDGERFFNLPAPLPEQLQRMSPWLWLLTRERGAWKRKSVTPSVPPERVHDGVLVTYINHATVLIQFSGINIITDPVFSYRASPFSFMGPIRYADPGVRLNDLPPIDIVLLSHNHYDHMDLVSLRAIHSKWHPRIYTGLGNTAYLKRKGIEGGIDMDWWDVREDGTISITSVPAQHFSARSISDRNKTLWCGFVLRTPHGNFYFSGDTGFGPFIERIAAQFAPVSLALLPIGAYEPAWMMQRVHTNPDEALRMHDILRSSLSIGIHYGTFRLTDEPQDEPAERIEAGRGDRDFRALQNGATVLMKAGLSQNS